ncbi:MAG: S8 family serine peptidase [Elusimicrobiota bacterium]
MDRTVFNKKNLNLRRIKSCILFFLIYLFFISPVYGRKIVSYSVGGRKVRAVEGELLVKFRDNISGEKRKQYIKNKGAEKTGEFKRIDAVKLKVPENTLEDVMNAFNNNPDIEFAEPNMILTALKNIKLPSIYSTEQELEDNQWGLTKIEAHYGWDIETGTGAVIAVIDSGVDLDHQDLVGNIWENSDETEDGSDSDLNGYADDINGWDFVDGDSDPNPDLNDNEGHGTHVAGIAAAAGNVEIIGASWGNKIMALRTLAYNSEINNVTGDTSDLIEAIGYAADNNADVINMSLGMDTDNSALDTAVQDAYQSGCVLVASSGNDDENNIFYPARYEEVIAVGATNKYDDRVSSPYWGSNYGDTLDLMAPGAYINSTVPGDSYGEWSGTSMAAPFVAGMASLMISSYGQLEPAEIKDRLIQSADDLNGAGWDIYTGYGRINCYKALTSYISVSPSSFDILNVVDQPPPEDRVITLSYTGGEKSTFTWTASKEVNWFSLSPASGTLTYKEELDLNISFDIDELSTGTYNADITVFSEESAVSTRTVSVNLQKIIAEPEIVVDKNIIRFFAVEQNDMPEKSISIKNDGDKYSILNWKTDSDADWLVLSSTYGALSYEDEIELDASVDLTGLQSKNYETTLTIFDSTDTTREFKVNIKVSRLTEEKEEVAIVGGRQGYVDPSKEEYAEIIFNSSESGRATAKIFDRLGRLVWENTKNINSGNNYIEWDCKNSYGEVVSSGIYILHITAPNIDTTRKIAVVR